MIIEERKLIDAVNAFVRNSGGRRENERFGSFFCRTFKILDPMIARMERDEDALELAYKKWVDKGTRYKREVSISHDRKAGNETGLREASR